MSQQESAELTPWERAHRTAVHIDKARARALPKITRKDAARRASMSPEWWTACVNGERSAGAGQRVLITPTDDTLIRMGRAVGIERKVRELLGSSPEVDSPAEAPDERTDEELLDELTDAVRRLVAEVDRRRARGRDQTG